MHTHTLTHKQTYELGQTININHLKSKMQFGEKDRERQSDRDGEGEYAAISRKEMTRKKNTVNENCLKAKKEKEIIIISIGRADT